MHWNGCEETDRCWNMVKNPEKASQNLESQGISRSAWNGLNQQRRRLIIARKRVVGGGELSEKGTKCQRS